MDDSVHLTIGRSDESSDEGDSIRGAGMTTDISALQWMYLLRHLHSCISFQQICFLFM